MFTDHELPEPLTDTPARTVACLLEVDMTGPQYLGPVADRHDPFDTQATS